MCRFSLYFAISQLLFLLLTDILPPKFNFLSFLRPFTVKEASMLVCLRCYPVSANCYLPPSISTMIDTMTIDFLFSALQYFGAPPVKQTG